ncbi:hypothetical protein BEN30_08990 [Magnetovibrio blakemorei]|uniref:Uncharacterized protein n=1 Tax=Magnetovibrio blakemorei TaxID=28181 RepID=A0A1E5Q930_9PROT|nr:hypothetical protein BEN30_08990 [Magnetovibrio blakemorei]
MDETPKIFQAQEKASKALSKSRIMQGERRKGFPFFAAIVPYKPYMPRCKRSGLKFWMGWL